MAKILKYLLKILTYRLPVWLAILCALVPMALWRIVRPVDARSIIVYRNVPYPVERIVERPSAIPDAIVIYKPTVKVRDTCLTVPVAPEIRWLVIPGTMSGLPAIQRSRFEITVPVWDGTRFTEYKYGWKQPSRWYPSMGAFYTTGAYGPTMAIEFDGVKVGAMAGILFDASYRGTPRPLLSLRYKVR